MFELEMTRKILQSTYLPPLALAIKYHSKESLELDSIFLISLNNF